MSFKRDVFKAIGICVIISVVYLYNKNKENLMKNDNFNINRNPGINFYPSIDSNIMPILNNPKIKLTTDPFNPSDRFKFDDSEIKKSHEKILNPTPRKPLSIDSEMKKFPLPEIDKSLKKIDVIEPVNFEKIFQKDSN